MHVAGLTMPCRAQEGTPGPATPAFDANTELRIEAAVKERVGAELMEVMLQGPPAHGRQQVPFMHHRQRAAAKHAELSSRILLTVSVFIPLELQGSLAYRHCQRATDIELLMRCDQ